MKTLKNMKTLSYSQMNQIKGGGEVIYPHKDMPIIIPPPPPPPPSWRISAKRPVIGNNLVTI